MFALFLVLNHTERLDEILDALYELGLGSTTFDSIGMGKVLLEHNIGKNIFSSLTSTLNEGKPYNKTLVSVIKEQDLLDKTVEIISDILEIDNPQSDGFLFVLPVLYTRGGHSANF